VTLHANSIAGHFTIG